MIFTFIKQWDGNDDEDEKPKPKSRKKPANTNNKAEKGGKSIGYDIFFYFIQII